MGLTIAVVFRVLKTHGAACRSWRSGSALLINGRVGVRGGPGCWWRVNEKSDRGGNDWRGVGRGSEREKKRQGTEGRKRPRSPGLPVARSASRAGGLVLVSGGDAERADGSGGGGGQRGLVAFLHPKERRSDQLQLHTTRKTSNQALAHAPPQSRSHRETMSHNFLPRPLLSRLSKLNLRRAVPCPDLFSIRNKPSARSNWPPPSPDQEGLPRNIVFPRSLPPSLPASRPSTARGPALVGSACFMKL